jgi:predicted nucleic acid-binding protein
MILVDTNVFSELVKPVPNANVVDWLFAHRDQTLLSTIVVAEIEFGVRTTRGADKRKMLSGWLERLIERHEGRIVEFDLPAARRWAAFSAGVLIADERAGSRHFDTLIAAQALVLDVPLATRNLRHFERTEVRIIDPWNA